MAAIIYSLCALTSLACFVFLWRTWRLGGHRLLFWSALCFALLTVNNVVLVVDKVMLPDADLKLWRLAVGFAAVMLLVVGLVWEED
ncbi:DUF5985 family protein [Caenimonas aquaedulcis]|uniref:Uncharacterized protein n=1 Tax=Caenimonas aquaedulcis TaxID=2793270 RepID=A0A931H4J7_9BURK|nr:DUF5985 family protein [Caenimonas aquaedulcis]MBG9388423.1 hypothetical protein [Caenimonas aquaedulcis]